MVYKFKKAREARMGRNTVKSSNPNFKNPKKPTIQEDNKASLDYVGVDMRR
jgi:hypothetical protein